MLYAAVPHQLEAATVFEMSRPLAEPTLRPTMSAKDEMTPARSRAPREVSASAASSRPGWEEWPQHSTHEHQQQHDGRRTPAEQRYWTALLSHGPVTGLHGPCQRTYTRIYPRPPIHIYMRNAHSGSLRSATCAVCRPGVGVCFCLPNRLSACWRGDFCRRAVGRCSQGSRCSHRRIVPPARAAHRPAIVSSNP